jgi:DNA replicative helicase MCM subunit Mcm2 (Cdc46/Mcm family)
VADYAFKKAKIINNIDAISKEEEKYYNDLRKYILYCKRFDPMLSKEAEVMIVQYYTSIMTKAESYQSPRLFDTLTSLVLTSLVLVLTSLAVARLKQKNTIDIEDVSDVIKFYNEQLLHLSQLVSVPRDPRDLAFEEIVSAFKGSAFKGNFLLLGVSMNGCPVAL